jgi:hypothetical protein
MTVISKTLIPNKEWILKRDKEKIGSISKNKKGFNFFKKGYKFFLENPDEVKKELGVDLISLPSTTFKKVNSITELKVYDFPCNSKPYSSVYNIKKKLPLYAKSSKSKSQYCAGYYVIKFRKGWVKSFCPKLITLERYKFYGPFKTEQEMKNKLNTVSKDETT